MSDKHISKVVGGLRGVVRVPGDKSISHRSLMLAALSTGMVRVTNFLRAQDCLSTLAGIRALGVQVDEEPDGALVVHGAGLHGLREPTGIIDAGDSGTMLRLMLGLLCAQPFLTTFTGDAALYRRPMGRVINPLRAMGANIFGRNGNKKLPVTIVPTAGSLKPFTYEMPVASAQVKSAILLAGLTAGVPVAIHESHPTRDHTECMLRAFGVDVATEPDNNGGTWVRLPVVDKLTAPEAIDVPGDISSAAFWLVAASVIPGSDLTLENVGLNPTRTGVIDVLRDMGGDIEILNERSSGGEPLGDLRARATRLRGVEFGGAIIPRLVDEIPVLAVAAMRAEGATTITGAHELRVKETDRIHAVATEFNKLCPCVRELDDGLVIAPPAAPVFQSASCFSYDDHRIAMALAIAGSAMSGVDIANADCVDISYPEFFATLAEVSRKPLTIAIDGPAGAGKSTIAKRVAEKLRYTYIDTGAMYRAVAWCALQAGRSVTDELITKVSDAIDVRLSCTDKGTVVVANGVDITAGIRKPEVTRIVSQVARLAPVRAKMVQLQRRMAEQGGVVMDGRDIASKVLPNADVKIFLTASLEERAQRRSRELAVQGYAVDLAALQAEIATRDKADSEREISPLVRVPEAALVDSTGMAIDEVVAAILERCRHV